MKISFFILCVFVSHAVLSNSQKPLYHILGRYELRVGKTALANLYYGSNSFNGSMTNYDFKSRILISNQSTKLELVEYHTSGPDRDFNRKILCGDSSGSCTDLKFIDFPYDLSIPTYYDKSVFIVLSYEDKKYTYTVDSFKRNHWSLSRFFVEGTPID